MYGYDAGAELLAGAYPEWRQRLLDPRQADWFQHCAVLGLESACLVVGSRWGGISRALMHYFQTVWSLEWDDACLRFQNAFRQREAGFRLRPLRASPLSLPFADASLELVAAPDVWPRLRSHFPRVPAETLFWMWLRECRRVLVPGGRLILGLERKSGRRQADMQLAPVRREGMSWPGRLRACGFAGSEAFWAWPDIAAPKCIGRLETVSLQALVRHHAQDPGLRLEARGRAAACAILRRLRFPIRPSGRLSRWLAPGMFWIATTPASASRPRLAARLGDWQLTVGGSDKVIWLRPTDKNAVVAKTPRQIADQRAIERQEKLAEYFGGVRVEQEKLENWPVFRELPPQGRPLRAGAWRECAVAVRWLSRFQQTGARGQWTAGGLEAEIDSWLQQFHLHARNTQLLHRLEQAALRLTASLEALPMVMEHGDFWPGNLLVRPGGELQVIDWEHYRPFGDPLFDIAMLAHNLWLQWRTPLPAAMQRFSRRRRLHRLLGLYAREHGIPAALVGNYMPLAVVRLFNRNHTGGRIYLLRQLANWDFPRLDECSGKEGDCGCRDWSHASYYY